MTFRYLPLFGFLLIAASCQRNKPSLFEPLTAAETGITFANRLEETEQANILTYEYFYNGGGVAAGDFSNDGRVDLFFTGNQVDNRLYLNGGGLKFEDVSERAGIAGRKGGWKTGVSLVDINADGWLDIYVCYSGPRPPEERRNQLFINEGAKGTLTFREQAEAYGLADEGYSTQAVFFDYDGDDDLDALLMNHNLRGYQRQEAHVMRAARDEYAGDKLFRNDNGRFVEVSAASGIKSNPLGFGLGLAVSDLNGDNQPDIYLGNDYVEDDYLYINQGNGTYQDELRNRVTHTSRFTMGVDIADVNNDTIPDLFTLDMLPEDNQRQKLLTFPDNWNTYQSTLYNGFWHQYMRNMLQLGTRTRKGVTYTEIGQLAGLSNTDWSWSALFADFDNDGWKDLFVSNGELKDLTDSDFIKYSADEEMKKAAGQPNEALLEQIKKMPSSQTRHYIFKNLNGTRFENRQQVWGFGEPAIANGAVYADLDNDGDLEIITNTNNGEARIYKNNLQERARADEQEALPKEHYLKINLKGSPKNPFGLGAKVWVYGKNTTQYQEFSPVRGFQSSMYDALHFGLGRLAEPVRVKVVWRDGRQQVIERVPPDQQLSLNHREAREGAIAGPTVTGLLEAADSLPQYRHRENYVNDFNRQVLLPYMYSYAGARMAKADINGDGLEDLYLGGARNQPGVMYVQRKSGVDAPAAFVPYPQWAGKAGEADSVYEDRDAVFFDADGDRDLDLYVVSGDYGLTRNHPNQQDRLYLNEGKGPAGLPTYRRLKEALPEEIINSSCVKVLDVEGDGDQDLFVGGTVIPGFYPLGEPSFLLVNQGRDQGGNLKFTREGVFALGMVSDATVVDIDGNGAPDLVVVGEWMSPTVLYNEKGKFTRQAKLPTVSSLNGWWNRIAAHDLDGDGDLDFVLGNLGLNCQMKASAKEPITLDFADFDQNGTIDPIMSYFIQGVSYPAVGRDEALEQVVTLRKKFTDYASFSRATLKDFFPEEQLKKAGHLSIDFTETIVLENAGKEFVVHRLPVEAQYSPVYAIATGDFNSDGHQDILLGGNNATYRLRIGKMDANQGILLAGKGKLEFAYVPQARSGLQLTGDVRDIQEINGKTFLFFTNNGPVRVYRKSTVKTDTVGPQASNP